MRPLESRVDFHSKVRNTPRSDLRSTRLPDLQPHLLHATMVAWILSKEVNSLLPAHTVHSNGEKIFEKSRPAMSAPLMFKIPLIPFGSDF